MEIGKKFRIGKELCHFIGKVMDGDETIIIYKVWCPWKRYYVYKCISEYMLEDIMKIQRKR